MRKYSKKGLEKPIILTELVSFLEDTQLVSDENAEGRYGSTADENNITTLIKQDAYWSKYVYRDSMVSTRSFIDIALKDLTLIDGHDIYPINIKTSKLDTSDNVLSKQGFLYALTSMTIEELPGQMTWDKFLELFSAHTVNIPNKDYWYLVFDKSNMQNVFLRGSKQIINWKSNPSNDIQIDWKKEVLSTEKGYSYKESCENIIYTLKDAAMKRNKRDFNLRNFTL